MLKVEINAIVTAISLLFFTFLQTSRPTSLYDMGR